MINNLSSGAVDPSEGFVAAERKSGQDNIAWIRENLKGSKDRTALVMVGGKSPTSFRLRRAHSCVRSYMMPSYWSHVMMRAEPQDDFGATEIVEISLEPREGFGFPVPENGIEHDKLGQDARRNDYPNGAFLSVPVKPADVNAALDKFMKQRAVLDAV